jgi:hypothetical protein
MVKIIVFEDDEIDTNLRYRSLLEDHQVNVRIVDFRGDHFRNEMFREYLVKKGFDGSLIHKFSSTSTEESADIYFVDGLVGNCFRILPKLPKEKTYLNSGDASIVDSARCEGYKILEGSIDDVVEKLSVQ